MERVCKEGRFETSDEETRSTRRRLQRDFQVSLKQQLYSLQGAQETEAGDGEGLGEEIQETDDTFHFDAERDEVVDGHLPDPLLRNEGSLEAFVENHDSDGKALPARPENSSLEREDSSSGHSAILYAGGAAAFARKTPWPSSANRFPGASSFSKSVSQLPSLCCASCVSPVLILGVYRRLRAAPSYRAVQTPVELGGSASAD